MAATKLDSTRQGPFTLTHDVTPRDPYIPAADSMIKTEPPNQSYRFRGYPEGFMMDKRQPIIGEDPIMPKDDPFMNHRKSQFMRPDKPRTNDMPIGGLEYGSEHVPKDRSMNPRKFTNPLEDKSSAELRKFRQQQDETEKFISDYKEWKGQQNRLRDDERKKDMEMLKNYNPFGKPGAGAPIAKEDHRKLKFGEDQLHKMDGETHMQSGGDDGYFPSFGKPGAGAPLRTSSGKLITEIKGDPMIRFHDDPRKERFLEGARYKPDASMAQNYQRQLDQQLHDKIMHEHQAREAERQKEYEMLRYDPFGKPGAGAPNKTRSGTRQMLGRNTTLTRDNAEWRHVAHKLEGETRTDDNFYDPFGKGFGNPERDTNLNVKRHKNADKDKGVVEYYDPSAKGFSLELGGAGAGAPRKTSSGHIVTRFKTTMNRDEFGEATIQQELPGQRRLEHSKSEDSYNPWGKSGAGAPIRDNEGRIITHRSRHDTASAEMRRRARGITLHEQIKQMEEQEQLRKQEQRYNDKPAGDLADLMNRGQVGKPRRDPNTGLLVNQNLPTSDVTKQLTDERRYKTNASREYHDSLAVQARERQLKMALGGRKEKQEANLHQETYNNFWGRPGGGAPLDHHTKKGNLSNMLDSPRRDHNDYVKFVETDSRTSIGAFQPRSFVRTTNGSTHANQYEVSAPKRGKVDYSPSAPWATN